MSSEEKKEESKNLEIFLGTSLICNVALLIVMALNREQIAHHQYKIDVLLEKIEEQNVLIYDMHLRETMKIRNQLQEFIKKKLSHWLLIEPKKQEEKEEVKNDI